MPTEDPTSKWPYTPGPAAISEAMHSATQFYTAVRATPPAGQDDEGGPSWPLGSLTLAAFTYAAGCAEGFWPNADSFDLIQSDARMDPKRIISLGLPQGCTLLRNANVVATFKVLDRLGRSA